MSLEDTVAAMQWTQGEHTVALDAMPDDVVAALGRIWSRIARGVADLEAEDWERPSRCGEWTVVDLVNHIADLNTLSHQVLQAAARGERAGIFRGFDPRTVPKSLTAAASRAPADARGRLETSVQALLDDIDSLDVRAVEPLVETPMGAQPAAAALLHLFWDTWLHERDLFTPLGHAVPEVRDEVLLAALYTLRMIGGVESLFQRSVQATLRLQGSLDARLRLEVTKQSVRCAVLDDEDTAESDDAASELRGDAASAVDALTGRGDLAEALQGPDQVRSQLGALRQVLAGA